MELQILIVLVILIKIENQVGEILFLFNSSSHLDQAEIEETGAVVTPLLSS